jgi:hypothetical protein
MIPISSIVTVTTVVGAAPVARFNFGTYMHVAEHNITANRMDGPYTSIAEVEAAGFTSSAAPTVYYAAAAAFGIASPVDSLLVGRKIPSTGGPLGKVWQVVAAGPTFVDETTDANDAGAGDWAIFAAGEVVGDYMAIGQAVPFTSITFSSAGGTAGVDAGSLALAFEFWDGAAWSALTGVVDGTALFTAVAGAGQVFSFTQPSTWAQLALNGSDPLYFIRWRITAGSYSTDALYTSGFVTGDASWAVALSAIEAVEDAEAWYGHTITSRAQADIEGVAAWTEPRFHRFVPQSADATFLNGTAGNVALVLKAAGYTRSAGPLYHSVSSGSANGYADSAWSSAGWGFDLDSRSDNWMFQQLAGITGDSLNSAQVAAILDANGNLFSNVGGASIAMKGFTPLGAPYFMDIQSSIDWFKKRVGEDVFAYMVANRPAYTNSAIQDIGGVVKNRLELGVSAGHFSPDFPRIVTVPDVADVSAQDKIERRLRVSCSAAFAGKIHSLDLTIYVGF